jgi:hypothetical protein
MKRTTIAIAILLAVNTNSFAQNPTRKSGSHGHKTTTSKGAKYTCTMHPEVVMNKAGKCPKCEMTLVKVNPGKKAPK